MVTTSTASRVPLLQNAGAVVGDVMALVPLMLLRPAFARIALTLARKRPDLFERMGNHAHKRFLIDPTDLPYVFLMVPDVAKPALTIHLRRDRPPHHGAIAGCFLDLFDMMDGALDGDALFFNRALSVTGDIEAVVALRNALDDFDGDLVDELLSSFGPLPFIGSATLGFLRRVLRGART